MPDQPDLLDRLEIAAARLTEKLDQFSKSASFIWERECAISLGYCARDLDLALLLTDVTAEIGRLRKVRDDLAELVAESFGEARDEYENNPDGDLPFCVSKSKAAVNKILKEEPKS